MNKQKNESGSENRNAASAAITEQIKSEANVPAPESTGESKLSLVALMGLPASGKSTLANKLFQFYSSLHVIIVSFDDFVPLSIQAKISQEKLVAGDNEQTKQITDAKVLRKKFIQCVDIIVRFVNSVNQDTESCLENCKLLLSSECTNYISNESFLSNTKRIIETFSMSKGKSNFEKYIILVDDNNYYHSMRNDFYQVAKKVEIGFCILSCKASLKECIRRNAHRLPEHQVPPQTIVEMNLKFEDPNPLQNTCDMYCIGVDTDQQLDDPSLHLITHIIDASFKNPVKPTPDRTVEIEQQRRVCSENEVHQADLMLRKWIGKKINLASFSSMLSAKSDNSSSNVDKKNLSKEMQRRKKITLEKLRSGELQIRYETCQDLEFQNEIVQMFESVSLT